MPVSFFSSMALISSGVKSTYCPFENSRPFIMSSFSTFSPVFESMYCCLQRAPVFLLIQLNEMAAADSEAEYIWIGTETRPKEIVAELIGRALIGSDRIFRRGPPCKSWGSGRARNIIEDNRIRARPPGRSIRQAGLRGVSRGPGWRCHIT